MNYFNIAVAVLQFGASIQFLVRGNTNLCILMFLYALTNLVLGRL